MAAGFLDRRGHLLGAEELAPLVLAWVGTGVIVTAGPTHIALSDHGNPSTALPAVSVIASLRGLPLTRSAVPAFAHRPRHAA